MYIQKKEQISAPFTNIIFTRYTYRRLQIAPDLLRN